MLGKALDQQANAVATAKDKLDEANKDTDNKERKAAQAKREQQAEALKTFQQHIQALNEADNARTEMYKKNMELQNEADNARVALAKRVQAEYVHGVELENEADNARTAMFQKQTELESEAEMARAKMADQQINDDLKIQEAKKELDATILESSAKLRKDTAVTFQALASAWMKAAAPLKQLGEEGQEAFNKLTSGLESAVAASILSGASFGHAMEEMTRQVLAGISAQAAVKALYYAAEGTAMLFTPGMQASAAGYFTASGEMAAIALVSGVTAHEMPGGSFSGGSSSNTEQSHSSGSSTGQSNRSGGSLVGVQAFADGGLIQAPTLSMIGEAGREAVLPLDDPRAMDSIREGIGGGTTHHWHIEGMISPDNLGKVVKQISRAVNKGQVNLTASNSLRLTKRSA
jgi:hypothetical protein